MPSGKPDDGIDAPGVLAVVAAVRAVGPSVIAAAAAAAWTALPAAHGFDIAAFMTWGSRAGKRRPRERLLDRIDALVPRRGGEIVLDVGCRRGLMLVGAARRLPPGTRGGSGGPCRAYGAAMEPSARLRARSQRLPCRTLHEGRRVIRHAYHVSRLPPEDARPARMPRPFPARGRARRLVAT